MTGGGESLFARLVDLIGVDAYLRFAVAGSVVSVVLAFRAQRARAAERMARWREDDDAGVPFEARVAERLRRLDP